jgi:hypothetical protein
MIVRAVLSSFVWITRAIHSHRRTPFQETHGDALHREAEPCCKKTSAGRSHTQVQPARR